MITNCFPLSIYKDKMGIKKKPRDKMSAIILKDSGDQQNSDSNSTITWTGDVHGQSSLHLREEFNPMVAGFSQHATEYLTQLGHKTDDIDIYITRCWGTMSLAQQAISNHNHRNSAISIVYYLSLPEGSANLGFHNSQIQNELSPEFAHPDRVRAGKIDPRNPLSAYRLIMPVEEDDIVIFPSAAFHGVNPGRQSQPRVSVAADTLIVESKVSDEEYLLPPLSTWKKMG